LFNANSSPRKDLCFSSRLYFLYFLSSKISISPYSSTQSISVHSFQFFGTGGDTAYAFYFQKPRNSDNSDGDTEVRVPYNTTKVKFCTGCGNSNKSDADMCSKCGRDI